MTNEEMLRLLGYQARMMVHLHGLGEGQKWLDLLDGVTKLIEENTMFRDNLEYCQTINGACRKELREMNEAQ